MIASLDVTFISPLMLNTIWRESQNDQITVPTTVICNLQCMEFRNHHHLLCISITKHLVPLKWKSGAAKNSSVHEKELQRNMTWGQKCEAIIYSEKRSEDEWWVHELSIFLKLKWPLPSSRLFVTWTQLWNIINSTTEVLHQETIWIFWNYLFIIVDNWQKIYFILHCVTSRNGGGRIQRSIGTTTQTQSTWIYTGYELEIFLCVSLLVLPITCFLVFQTKLV